MNTLVSYIEWFFLFLFITAHLIFGSSIDGYLGGFQTGLTEGFVPTGPPSIPTFTLVPLTPTASETPTRPAPTRIPTSMPLRGCKPEDTPTGTPTSTATSTPTTTVTPETKEEKKPEKETPIALPTAKLTPAPTLTSAPIPVEVATPDISAGPPFGVIPVETPLD